MQLADILTKDEGGAADLWRSAVRCGEHTLANEDDVLMRRAEEKERRQDEQMKKRMTKRKGSEKAEAEAEADWLTACESLGLCVCADGEIMFCA